ncbi:MAG: DUF5640 domain-containing protein [Defluviitaleaceae bacterium]|nr:DUF5640 domain-containing protein [Defluviitaleaceae bacterium]
MKKYLMALAATIAFCAVLLLSGCASRDEDLVGTWIWQDNPAYITTFEANGNGTNAITWGHGTEFTWTTRGNNIYKRFYGSRDRYYFEYSVNGDILNFYDEGVLVFRYVRQR